MPYIDKCEACGVEKGVVNSLCKQCLRELVKLKHGATEAKDLSAFAVYDYSGLVGKIIRDYKYNGKRYLSAFMAKEMAAAVKGDYSAICNVPLPHWWRTTGRSLSASNDNAAGTVLLSASAP
jgi:predicted amidophosphoribosyltransferase